MRELPTTMALDHCQQAPVEGLPSTLSQSRGLWLGGFCLRFRSGLTIPSAQLPVKTFRRSHCSWHVKDVIDSAYRAARCGRRGRIVYDPSGSLSGRCECTIALALIERRHTTGCTWKE